MIYLIGGPPRCGKTILARKMSKQTKIPWISCDTLDAISQEYVSSRDWAKKYPYSALRRKRGARDNDVFYSENSAGKIVSLLIKEAKSVYKAIETMIACQIADGDDFIIEGYQILPGFADKMIKKFGKQNIRVIFLAKFDANKFAKDVHHSSNANDWLLKITKNKETFVRVGKMVSLYSRYFEKEAKKFGLCIFDTDKHFNNQVSGMVKYMIG